MKLFSPIHSALLSLRITLTRNIDHTYRRVRGVPTLRYSTITPQLYLGGQYSTKGFKVLKRRGITGIVSMRLRARENLPHFEGIELLHLPTPDLQAPTLDQLEKGAVFIRDHIKNNGKVYVHCAAGEGRGPTMVAAYLITTGLTLEDALSQIRAVRRFIRPTQPQLMLLKDFESIHLP